MSNDSANELKILLEQESGSLLGHDSILAVSTLLNEDVLDLVVSTARKLLNDGNAAQAQTSLVACEWAARMSGNTDIEHWTKIERGKLSITIGNVERALSFMTDGFEYFDKNIDPQIQENTFFQSYLDAGLWLSTYLLDKKRVSEGRNLLINILRKTEGTENSKARANAVANLFSISLSVNDLQSAETHALYLLEDNTWTLFDQKSLSYLKDQLIYLATTLYSMGESKLDSTYRIANKLIANSDPNGSLYLVLCYTAFNQEKYEESIKYANLMLENPSLLPDYDYSRILHRKSISLNRLGDNEQAIETIKAAIELQPKRPYLWFAIGQLYEMNSNYEETVNAYSRVVEICSELLKEEQEESYAPQSQQDYMNNMPIGDLRDFAIFRKSDVMRKNGQEDEAVKTLHQIIEESDNISVTGAYSILATWKRENGNLDEAASLLEKLLSEDESINPEPTLELADIYLQMEKYAESFERIKPMCYKSYLPDKCIELLNQFPKTLENYISIKKYIGYAKTEAGRPSEGMVDLDEVVKESPNDTEALIFRALARITNGLGKEFNNSRSSEHVYKSMGDLIQVLKIDETHEEARRILKWLIERVISHPILNELIKAGGSPDQSLFKFYPHLEEAFKAESEANFHTFNLKWNECLKKLKEAQDLFEKAGFEILKTRINLNLADVSIRLYDFANIQKYLDEADKLIGMVNVPLSKDVHQHYNQSIENRGAYEPVTTGFELEYLWIYGFGMHDMNLKKLIESNYLHRIGDIQGALKIVDSFSSEEIESSFIAIFGIEAVMWIVAILRDGKRYDEALSVLASSEQNAKESGRYLDIIYGRGLIYDLRGEAESARKAYEECIERRNERSRPIGLELDIQYASSLLRTGNAEKALETLEAIDLASHNTARVRLQYFIIKSAVYSSLENNEEGIEAAKKGIELAEEHRKLFEDIASRRAWYNQMYRLFGIAVGLYTRSGRHKEGWQTVEMSKSRTLIEELIGNQGFIDDKGEMLNDLERVTQTLAAVNQRINDPSKSPSLEIEFFKDLSEQLGDKFDYITESSEFQEKDLEKLKRTLTHLKGNIASKIKKIKEKDIDPVDETISPDQISEILIE